MYKEGELRLDTTLIPRPDPTLVQIYIYISFFNFLNDQIWYLYNIAIYFFR